MYRKLASAVLVASALNAKYALALGLGGITMHSALNQPLAAEISLSSAGDLDKSQILISLASQEDFLRAGVDRSFFLSDIKFDVVLDGKGGGVIKLRSTRRLNEPYLDLLIEAKWPTGRMLRSYTALVDLPVYAEDNAAQVNAGNIEQEQEPALAQPVTPSSPASSTSSAVSASAPVRSKTDKSAEAKKPSRVLQPAHPGSEYRIQPNETLSQIAAKLNPGAEFSVNQTMLAIQKLNPHAFVRNNINLIKAGAVLRVPSAADVSQFSATSASREVVEQTRQWRGAQLDATDATAGAYRQAALKEEGHLSLTSAGSGLASGKDKVADAGAQQQSGLASGDVQVSERERKELHSQVESLNTEVSKLKRMIELKDQELAALQKNLGKKPDAGSPEVQPVAEKPVVETQKQPAESKVEKPISVASEPASEKVDKPPVDQKASEKPLDKPKKVEKTTPSAEPVKEPGLLEQLKANPLYIGGVALLLIFAVVAFIFRRKAQAESQAMAENDIGNFDFDRAVAHEDVLENLPSEQELDDFVSAEESVGDVEGGFDEQSSTVMQTSDPIGEADIYIAYGRYDQAAELLLNAISAAPDDVSLRSKLLEVYIESKNRSGFQQQYLELQAMGQTAAISNAKELLTSAGAADWLDNLPVEEVSDAFAQEIDQSVDLLDVDLVEDDIDVYRAGNTDSEFSFDEFESVSKPDPEEESIVSLGDDLADLDLSDLQLPEVEDSGEDSGFADVSESEALISEVVRPEVAADDDFSLDLSDLDLEAADTDLSFGLDDNVEAGIADVDSTADELDLSDLSFELPEDFASETVVPEEETVVSAGADVSFDDIDLGFDEMAADVVAADATVASDEFVSDELSFEDFDLGVDVEEQVFAEAEEAVTTELDETSALDFADMDFGLEDGSGLVSPGAEVDGDAGIAADIELPVDEALPAEDLALESDFEFGEVTEPASEELAAFDNAGVVDSALAEIDQPHVSAPLSTLESEDLEFLTDGDEVSTKLDLAQAYVDLGDVDGARDILLEVMKEGREDQKAEAAALLDSLD